MGWKRKLGVATAIAIVTSSFVANRTPHTPDEIALLSDRLFEFGAVDFVHSGYNGEENALFECVAKGLVLTQAQSMRYRETYQAILLSKQGLFTRLDANIELRTNEGMERANNVGAKGILGHHDHHDASAANNAHDIETGLSELALARPFKRTLIANDVYKDLIDLMVHMAPAIHSVGLLSPDAMPDHVAPFYHAMKRAQGAPVNGANYWLAVNDALNEYVHLVESTQTDIRTHNGPLLHAVSGRWLALQTIAPRLSVSSPSATTRQGNDAPCPA